jgi:predicted Zn finger-like uncharacterized protein
MILVCPSCETRYSTDAAALGPEGRRVRCASCGHAWFAKPGEEAPAEAQPAGLTREQVERLRQQAAAATRSGPHAEFRAREMARRRRNRAIAAAMGWAACVFVFAGAAGAAVAMRDDVVAAWPRAASVYSLVGVKVNRFGLDLVDVTAKRLFDETTPVLAVTGVAVNEGDTVRASPLVRISLRDEAGEEIGFWTDTLEVKEIAPGGRVRFSTRKVDPPLDTYSLAVTFEPAPRRDEAEASFAEGDEGAEAGADAGPDEEAALGAEAGDH